MKEQPGGSVPSTDVSPSGEVDVASTKSKSETPCWTCRRRRVLCDKALPTCAKCHKAGKECLGYKKPLVWNKGVASRGKMMGKTYKQPNSSSSSNESSPGTDPQVSLDPSTSPRASTSSSQADDDLEQTSWNVMILAKSPISIVGTLVDPIFQGLKPITRYYLDYFGHKICPEAVLHDLPGHNPFRDLIATVGSSPLLLKSMLAAAARHAANYMSSSSFTSASVPLASSGHLQLTPNSAQYHAYWYKQVSLTQLRKDLEKSNTSSIANDVVVASISLLIWIDLLEAGKNTWRIHLEGMKRFIGLKDTSTSTQASPSTSRHGNIISMHPYFFDICVMFDIMGTTLSRPYKINKPLPPTPTVKNCLFRTEKISFLGCPAELLYQIVIINWKCWTKNSSSNPASDIQDSSPSSTHFSDADLTNVEEAEEFSDVAILNRIQAFDASAWAVETTVYTPEPDTQERIHLALSYQFAILIYYHRVLSPLPVFSNTDFASITAASQTLLSLAHSTLDNLAQIPSSHPFIKSTVWPTFIAGAELIKPATFASPSTTSYPSSTPSPAPNTNATIYPPPSTTFSTSNPTSQLKIQSFTTNSIDKQPDYRRLTCRLLQNFWNEYHSANVINAAKVLEEMWKVNDLITQSMTQEEYEESEQAGKWSHGVLNCTELNGNAGGDVEDRRKAMGGGDERYRRGGWKDFWVGGDDDWLFV